MVQALKTVMALIPLHRCQHILQAVFYVTAKIKVETSQSTCDNSRLHIWNLDGDKSPYASQPPEFMKCQHSGFEH
jgi:hypothetical protein